MEKKVIKYFVFIYIIFGVNINNNIKCQIIERIYEDSIKSTCHEIITEEMKHSLFIRDGKERYLWIYKDIIKLELMLNKNIKNIIDMIKEQFMLKSQIILLYRIDGIKYITGGMFSFIYNKDTTFTITFCLDSINWKKAILHNGIEDDEFVTQSNLNLLLECKEFDVYQSLCPKPIPVPDAEDIKKTKKKTKKK